MSKPIGIDATIQTVIDLLNRVSADAEFRQSCERDIDAAIAELGTPPTPGVSFSYAHADGTHTLQVFRGGDVITCTASPQSGLVIDSDALGTVLPAEELDDEALLAVAGGWAATTEDYKNAAQYCFTGYAPGWGGYNVCGSGVCTAFKWTTGMGFQIPCNTNG